jgi:hypothetical protein
MDCTACRLGYNSIVGAHGAHAICKRCWRFGGHDGHGGRKMWRDLHACI